MKTLTEKISAAKAVYTEAVSAYTLDDLLNGNSEKDIAVDKSLDCLDRLERTNAVRVEAAKVRRDYHEKCFISQARRG